MIILYQTAINVSLNERVNFYDYSLLARAKFFFLNYFSVKFIILVEQMAPGRNVEHLKVTSLLLPAYISTVIVGGMVGNNFIDIST